jgi:ABC-type branched-subunit amino acid transport system substrate-binding protein
MPYPYAPKTALVGEYLAAGGSAGKKFAPNYSGIEGFAAAKTLVEALRRSGPNPTPDGLIAGMESLRDFNLGGFYVDFGPQKHTGSRYVDLIILTAEGRVRQ